MDWIIEWILKPLVGFVALAGVVGCTAWVAAIGWHIGRRDAAKWFGPTTSLHEVKMTPDKRDSQ